MTICSIPAGDKGQRYEVRYVDGKGEERVMGWTNAADGGGLAVSLKRHPIWKLARIVDRRALTPDQIAYLEEIQKATYDPLKLCEVCGAPMGAHVIGGPGPCHPR